MLIYLKPVLEQLAPKRVLSLQISFILYEITFNGYR